MADGAAFALSAEQDEKKALSSPSTLAGGADVTSENLPDACETTMSKDATENSATTPEADVPPPVKSRKSEGEVAVVPAELTDEVRRLLAEPCPKGWGVLAWNINGLDEEGGMDALMLRTLKVAQEIATHRPAVVMLQEVVLPALELLGAKQVLGSSYEVIAPEDPPLPYYVAILLDKERVRRIGDPVVMDFVGSQMGRQLLAVTVEPSSGGAPPMLLSTAQLETGEQQQFAAERSRQLVRSLRYLRKQLGSDSERPIALSALGGDFGLCDAELQQLLASRRGAELSGAADAFECCGSPAEERWTLQASSAKGARRERLLFLSPLLQQTAEALPVESAWLPDSVCLVGKDRVEGLDRCASKHRGLLTVWAFGPVEASRRPVPLQALPVEDGADGAAPETPAPKRRRGATKSEVGGASDRVQRSRAAASGVKTEVDEAEPLKAEPEAKDGTPEGARAAAATKPRRRMAVKAPPPDVIKKELVSSKRRRVIACAPAPAMEDEDTEGPSWKCQHCSTVYETSELLLMHFGSEHLEAQRAYDLARFQGGEQRSCPSMHKDGCASVFDVAQLAVWFKACEAEAEQRAKQRIQARKLSCQFCLYRAPNFDALMRHCLFQHKGKRIQQRHFTDHLPRLYELTAPGQATAMEEQDGLWKCSICGLLATHRSYQKQHIAKSHERHLVRMRYNKASQGGRTKVFGRFHVVPRDNGPEATGQATISQFLVSGPADRGGLARYFGKGGEQKEEKKEGEAPTPVRGGIAGYFSRSARTEGVADSSPAMETPPKEVVPPPPPVAVAPGSRRIRAKSGVAAAVKAPQPDDAAAPPTAASRRQRRGKAAEGGDHACGVCGCGFVSVRARSVHIAKAHGVKQPSDGAEVKRERAAEAGEAPVDAGEAPADAGEAPAAVDEAQDDDVGGSDGEGMAFGGL